MSYQWDGRRNIPMGHRGHRERPTFIHQEPRWAESPDDIPIPNDRELLRRRSPEEWYEEQMDVQRHWERPSGSHVPEYSQRDHYRPHVPRGGQWPNAASPFDSYRTHGPVRRGGEARDPSFSPVRSVSPIHERGGYDRQRSYSPINNPYERGAQRLPSGRSYEHERLPLRPSRGLGSVGDRQALPPPQRFQNRPCFAERVDGPRSLKPAGQKREEMGSMLAQPEAYGVILPDAGRAMDVTPELHMVAVQSKGQTVEPPKTKLALHGPSASPKMLDAPQPPTQSGQYNTSQVAEEVVSPAMTHAAAAHSVSSDLSNWMENTNLTDRVISPHPGLSFPAFPNDLNQALGPAFLQEFPSVGNENNGRLEFSEAIVASVPGTGPCEGGPVTGVAGGTPEPARQDGECLATSREIPFLSQKWDGSASFAVSFGVGKPLCRRSFAGMSPSSDEPSCSEENAFWGPVDTAAMNAKEPEGEQHLDTVDEEVLQKRREIEQAYREDCETFYTVVRMLVNKDPLLVKSLQAAMRANIVEMGQQCLQQLREFVASRKRQRSQENTSALPPVQPAP